MHKGKKLEQDSSSTTEKMTTGEIFSDADTKIEKEVADMRYSDHQKLDQWADNIASEAYKRAKKPGNKKKFRMNKTESIESAMSEHGWSKPTKSDS